MLPVTYDLDVYDGDTWAQTFRLKKGGNLLDLSSATVAAQARASHVPNATPVALTVTKGSPATNGEVTVKPPTAPADVTPGIYDWDLQVTIGAEVTTWVAGRLTVRRDVTP